MVTPDLLQLGPIAEVQLQILGLLDQLIYRQSLPGVEEVVSQALQSLPPMLYAFHQALNLSGMSVHATKYRIQSGPADVLLQGLVSQIPSVLH
jgi:hypothetical protein